MKQITFGDVVVVADFSAPFTAKKLFGPIRASAVEAISFLVIDPLNLVSPLKLIPRPGFASVDNRLLGEVPCRNDIACDSDLNTEGTESPPIQVKLPQFCIGRSGDGQDAGHFNAIRPQASLS
jgi:hypothetical protein